MSTPRELLERCLDYVSADDWDFPVSREKARQLRADIEAYLAAEPAQPPRVTAEMVEEAARASLEDEYSPPQGAWKSAGEEEREAHRKLARKMLDAARLSAEREPPTNPASVSSTLGVEAEREPGEAGT